MLTTTNFNSDDFNIILFSKNDVKSYAIIFLKIFLPLSFLLGTIGLLKRANGYWPTTLFFLIVFLLVTIYLILKEHILFTKDLKEQLKYVGTICVLKKSLDKRNCKIYTDAKEMKKIHIQFLSVFDQIEVGDELYLEIAKSSGHIFKLNKGELHLINGC
jgi:hypothetical protein